MAFSDILNPVLRPLLGLPPFVGIFIMALGITIVITLVYKYATDQERMKELKAKVKKYQERMKKLRDQPEKMMKVQQEAMSVNMELMKHSFKPTLYTMIPIIIIFSWMNANLAFYNIAPGENFTITAMGDGLVNASISFIPDEGVTLASNSVRPFVDGAAVWTLSAEAGTYKATIDAGGVPVEKQFIVTGERKYASVSQKYKSPVKLVTVSNRAVKPLEPLSLLGWHPGWLGTYILLSIILSIGLRKAFGVV